MAFLAGTPPRALPCYIFYSLFTAALFAIYPLWAFTAINKGGLGAPESSIGLQLSLRGLLHVLTMVVYAPIEKRLGLYRLYAWAMAMWILSTLCYPLLNLWARVNSSSDGIFFQFLVIIWFTIVSRVLRGLEPGFDVLCFSGRLRDLYGVSHRSRTRLSAKRY